MFGVLDAHDAHDHRSPVAALRHVLVVAEREHDLVVHGGHFAEAEGGLLGAGREDEAGEGGSDDVICLLAGFFGRDEIIDDLINLYKISKKIQSSITPPNDPGIRVEKEK